ncbi:unnamed protein product [Bursaphelenchus okinawaensis]|uniref:RING-type E3 ubiquitin transferase n=1 Tax=Bursaphelenchus okinawaensis TaxID=465554 RepID=A0A811KIL2_9BILA|nr:unnamed protein product [Bursaphelenchus okinawaensis]CAG9103457.1 unnamed protein product [Bursaphelenchus okinawaensis]
MSLFVAERTEILRGERKDEEYIQELYDKISDLVKRIYGDAIWIKAYKWLMPITKVLYYTSTSVKGVQTLGEEYMGLIPVGSQSEVRETSYLQRVLFVVGEAFGPLMVDKKLEEFRGKDDEYYRKQSLSSKVPIGRVVLSVLLKQLSFGSIQRLHWALFYLFGGNFYSLWKRISQTHFMTLNSETNVKMHSIFRIIGGTALLAFVLNLVFAVRRELLKRQRTRSDLEEHRVPPKDGAFFCDICLENGEPVSTPCGHVFCFDCIVFHSENADLDANKGQCPQCRFQFYLRSVIPLINY